MGTATSKSVGNDNIVVKNYKDDKNPYKFFSGYVYNKKEDTNDIEMAQNYLGDR